MEIKPNPQSYCDIHHPNKILHMDLLYEYQNFMQLKNTLYEW